MGSNTNFKQKYRCANNIFHCVTASEFQFNHLHEFILSQNNKCYACVSVLLMSAWNSRKQILFDMMHKCMSPIPLQLGYLHLPFFSLTGQWSVLSKRISLDPLGPFSFSSRPSVTLWWRFSYKKQNTEAWIHHIIITTCMYQGTQRYFKVHHGITVCQKHGGIIDSEINK